MKAYTWAAAPNENDFSRSNRIVHHDLVRGFRDIANLVESAYLNDGETFLDWNAVKEHADYLMREVMDWLETDETPTFRKQEERFKEFVEKNPDVAWDFIHRHIREKAEEDV